MHGGGGITYVRGSALDLLAVAINDEILLAAWHLVDLTLSLLRGFHYQLLEIFVRVFRAVAFLLLLFLILLVLSLHECSDRLAFLHRHPIHLASPHGPSSHDHIQAPTGPLGHLGGLRVTQLDLRLLRAVDPHDLLLSKGEHRGIVPEVRLLAAIGEGEEGEGYVGWGAVGEGEEVVGRGRGRGKRGQIGWGVRWGVREGQETFETLEELELLGKRLRASEAGVGPRKAGVRWGRVQVGEGLVI